MTLNDPLTGISRLRYFSTLNISETTRDREPQLLWNVNRKSYTLYRMVPFSMTLTDTNPVFKVTAYLKSTQIKSNKVDYGQSYYKTLIRNRTKSNRMVSLSMTLIGS